MSLNWTAPLPLLTPLVCTNPLAGQNRERSQFLSVRPAFGGNAHVERSAVTNAERRVSDE